MCDLVEEFIHSQHKQNSITNPTPTLSLSLSLPLSTFSPPDFKMCVFVPSISTDTPNTHSLVLIFFPYF